jgi:hypothetical protein
VGPYVNYIALIASILTIISVTINIIQYYRKRQETKSLRAQVQGSYNSHFLIARACTRSRDRKVNNEQERLAYLLQDMDYIRGISDSARTSIIAFSREHLGFEPFYEHPAQPGVRQPKEVIFGLPPDKVDTKQNSRSET